MNKLINVLLIDDDPKSNFIAEAILKKLEITRNIHIAHNGHEGLDFLLKPLPGDFICPELIILDRKMPVMNADEFIEALQNLAFVNRTEMVILLISSTLNEHQIQSFRTLGVSEFATKPLTTQRIMDLYNKYFRMEKGAAMQMS
jgi:CheY-like chemotaxis protein